MDRRSDLELAPRVVGALERLYAIPAPDPAFVARLERQLLGQGPSLPAARPVLPLWRRRWALGTLGLLLALLATLAALGPQRVWAAVERLLGYVPGIGFVDLDQTRVLAGPVSLSRDGVTLYVEQVLAGPRATTVVLRSSGLPAAEEWLSGGRKPPAEFEPALRLPGGEVLRPSGCESRLGAARLQFPPLPADVYRVTLALPRLPLVPAGAAPEGWEVALILRPATGELVAELFPQPYTPAGAEETHAGVTLAALSAAHSPQETALRLRVQWQDPAWEFHHLGLVQSPYLRDDLGHAYYQATGPGSNSPSQVEVVVVGRSADGTPAPALPEAVHEETQAFWPASPLARHLTLVVDGITFQVPADSHFTLDLGASPRVGDRWPLDIALDVAGFPVRLTGAELVQETTAPRERPEHRTVLQFDIAPVPDEAGRALVGLSLDGEASGFSGSLGGYSPVTNRLHAGVTLDEGAPLPGGVVRVQVRNALVGLRGPWEIAWTVPGDEQEAQAAPVVLRPGGVSQRRGDLALRLGEVVLSDRLTAVALALEGAPAGVTLSPIPYWDPATRSRGPLLSDDRGRRYEAGRVAVGWWPVGEAEPSAARYVFEPLQPLARRLTLHVPGVQLAWPGEEAFDVAVPGGLTMAPAEDERLSRESAAWAVDIPLEVAGYRLRFTEARLREMNGTTMLELVSAPYAPAEKDRWLSGLQLAAVRGPRGTPLPVGTALSAAGLGETPGTAHRAWLCFDVAHPVTGTVQPGRYHVELAGVTVAVRGPWAVACDLRR